MKILTRILKLMPLAALLFFGTFSYGQLVNQTFDGATFPPTGWTRINAGTGGNWTRSTATGYVISGTASARLLYNTTNAANTWLITPGVALTAGQTVAFSFNELTGGTPYTESMKVTVGTAATVAAQTTTLLNLPALTNTTPVLQSGTFSVPATGTYYFGFNCYSVADQFFLSIDDVLIDVQGACPTPVSGLATLVTSNSAQANWSLNTGNFIVEYGPTATFGTPGTGATAGNANNTIIAVSNANFATLSGLTFSTGYSYVVRQDCTGSGTGFSTNSAVRTFTTTVVPPNCATGLAPASGIAPLLCSATAPSSVAFTWTAPASGPVPTGYKVYFGAGVPALLGTTPNTFVSIYGLLPNTTYNWYIVPTNGGDAVGCNTPLTFTTDVEPPCVPNNTCATATFIGTTGNGGSVNSTTIAATISQVAEACNMDIGDADDDVWFSFTTDGDGGDVTIALTAPAAALDAIIQVYSGACGSLTNIGCADATGPAGIETATVTGLAASTTYYARVYGYGAFSSTTTTSGAFTLTTSGTGVAGALPLELKSFTGLVQGSTNLLNWETLTEKNVQFHIVERSIDGQRWSEVGRVNGKGDSQVSVKYSMPDNAPLARAYYRLRSVDFDGQENVSSSIVLTRKGENFGITSVYPSPTTSNVTVQFNSTSEEKVTVRVMDMTGRLVMQQVMEAVKDINELPITLTGLQAGVYSVTVSNSTTVSTPVRFVKQ